MKLLKKLGSSGFTLIELAIVIVILGILAAAVIPRYVDLSSSAETATLQANAAAVQSAFAIYLAENSGSFPSGTSLQNMVQPAATGAAGGGITFTINGNTRYVQTYTDTTCTTATSTAGQIVQCVGGAS